MGFKIGVCGLGFGGFFAELFHHHPDVDEVIVTDFLKDRVEAFVNKGITHSVESLDDLIKSDVDAIGIYTQRWAHAPQAIKCLKAGKHVYSAVPAAVTLEELDELVKTVEETGLMYMLGETSYYRPPVIFCRQRYARGEFGRFVYGEGQYHHDMSRFYRPYKTSNGPDWKKFASFPPMLYPTHSVSHICSVTFRRMTEVSCFGFVDNHPDGVFNKDLSYWGNTFSNEIGLFRTSDGGTARIGEFRRTGAGESRITIIGTHAAYEEQPSLYLPQHCYQAWRAGLAYPGGDSQGVFVKHTVKAEDANGEFDYENSYKNIIMEVEDMRSLHQLSGVVIDKARLGHLPPEYIGRRHDQTCWIHDVERLPKEFVGLHNGHAGSHQFLVCDFIEALKTGALPPNHVWAAARYNAPGIVAHASAMRDGELMKIPDFGMPPDDARLQDPMTRLLP